MNDLELSLDQIIQKKLGKTGLNRGRGVPIRKSTTVKRLSDQSNRANKNPRQMLTKNARSQPQATVGDARMKIIQKQRQKITDAREKLGQIAKQTDARIRLQKLREKQRALVQNIRGQKPRRGIIPDDHILQRTIRGRLESPTFDEELLDFSDEIAYMTKNFSDRAVIDADLFNFQFRGRQDAPVLYRTVENDLQSSRLFNQDKGMYSWTNPRATSAMAMDDLSDIPVKRTVGRNPTNLAERRELRSYSPTWEFDDSPIVITKKVKPLETVGILKRTSSTDREPIRIIKDSPPPSSKRGPARTLSERFCQDGNPSAQKISQLKARLEASQLNKKARAEMQAPQLGHRIVVSNLVPSVTHEDVKELFEDIGELLSSKVVRPGTAEVVYKMHKDAVKAVDVYHNRQLDGQPMKCLLVNNRSTLPISKTSKALERKIVELDMTAFRKALHKKSTS